MKRSRVLILVVGIFLILTCFFLISRQEKRTGVGLSQEQPMADPVTRQAVKDTREVLQHDMRPQDAKTLKSTGQLVLSWQEVKTYYPQLAVLADNYGESNRLMQLEQIRRTGEKPPAVVMDRLNTHHYPDTITINGWPSKCTLQITSNTGIHNMYLQISQ